MENNLVLEIKNVSHNFGSKNVLWDINLNVMAGEIVGLVGPSGCGKSTLLRAILGTHPAKHGVITVHEGLDNKELKVVTKASRDCGIVYQGYTLFPFLTALENVAYGLMLDETIVPDRIFRWKKSYRPRRDKSLSWSQLRKIHLGEAAALLDKLHLKEAMYCYPHELSGGMCQRVAIAQALIMKPKLLLLDEPFGALDEATREELQTMLLILYTENIEARKKGKMPPYTIFIVTHELNEAILVSDRVIGLSQYWDHKECDDPLSKGASTIVYDKVAPVFSPTQEKDFLKFKQQREEIRHAVMDPRVLQKRELFRIFWKQLHEGKGEGVLKNGN